MKTASLCATIALSALLPSCTVVRGTAEGEAPQIRFEGVFDGYAGFGWPESDSLIRLDVLDGRSSGSVAYLEIWRLLRLEVGLAGVAIGIGPFDVGIGTLFYEPKSPQYPYDEEQLGPLPDPSVIEWQGREPDDLRPPVVGGAGIGADADPDSAGDAP